MALPATETLLTSERELRAAAIDVDEEGRVASIGAAEGVLEPGALLPGFVDVQLNGALGRSLAEATDDAFDAVGRALLRAGTTSYCPTLPSAPSDVYPRFLDAAARAATRDGPQVLGVHLEGPFLNPRRRGAHPESVLRNPDADWLAGWLDRHEGLVRIVTLAPELPGAKDVISLCRERGVTVSVGHSDATAEEALAAFDAGASMLTHLFNGMRPIHHRDPGVAAAALSRQDVHCGVICDGRHIDPMVASLFLRTLGSRRAAVVSDAVGEPSEGPTLSGGFVLLDGALRNLLAWGLPLTEAVRMVTRTPAEAVGAQAGSLEVGSRADAVLWRGGRVARVFLAGREVEL
jgi:N-acetylglucosamine-6-phosphate deacetylase